VLSYGPHKENELINKIIHHSDEQQHFSSFNKEKNGLVLGIETHEDLKNHIIDTLNDPETRGFAASADGSKMIFYNEKTNTFISLDPESASGGTAFRPRTPHTGTKYFARQIKSYGDKMLSMPDVTPGGIKGTVSVFKATNGTLPKLLGALGDVGKSNKNIVLDAGIAVAAGGMALMAGATPAEAAYAAGETSIPSRKQRKPCFMESRAQKWQKPPFRMPRPGRAALQEDMPSASLVLWEALQSIPVSEQRLVQALAPSLAARAMPESPARSVTGFSVSLQVMRRRTLHLMKSVKSCPKNPHPICRRNFKRSPKFKVPMSSCKTHWIIYNKMAVSANLWCRSYRCKTNSIRK
ncbi:MAG: hypothetical protein KDJ32_10840, partial [Alphaproteobacteria bacterium]|nr:hypothetical protein [Alphaproteobacteria bacterium]